MWTKSALVCNFAALMCEDAKQAKMCSLERTRGTKVKQSFRSPGRASLDSLVSKVSMKTSSCSAGRVGVPRTVSNNIPRLFLASDSYERHICPFVVPQLYRKKEEIAYECRNRVLMSLSVSLLMPFHRIIDRVYHFSSQLELVYK